MYKSMEVFFLSHISRKVKPRSKLCSPKLFSQHSSTSQEIPIPYILPTHAAINTFVRSPISLCGVTLYIKKKLKKLYILFFMFFTKLR